LSSESRPWRTGLLLASGAFAVAWFFVSFSCTPVLPYCSTTVGFRADYVRGVASVLVTQVDRDSPAAVAGLRVGDRINLPEIGFRERWRLRDARRGYQFPLGERLHYVVHRGSETMHLSLSAQAVPPNWGDDWIIYLIDLWGIVFAAVLAVRRPDLPEARLLSMSLLAYFGGHQLTADIAPSPVVGWLGVVLGSILQTAVFATLCAKVFALFAQPVSRTRRWLTSLTIWLAVAFGLYDFVASATYFAFPLFPQLFLSAYGDYLLSCLDLAAVACGIAAVIASQAMDRPRAAWVLASYGPILLFSGIYGFVQPLLTTKADLSWNYALLAFDIVLPIGVTYSVLSRRLVDIGYVINRAAIFGAVSVVVLATFVVVEWILSSWISNASHTTSIVVNVVVALGLGLSLRLIHRRAERVVDRVFFRKRYEDEVALRRFAHEAAFITDRQILLERTAATIEEHADAGGVKLLFINGEALYENDPAVVAMRAWHEPVDLHRSNSEIEGERAFPMSSRGQLTGVLVCDAKRNGEAYSPDESEAIEAIAHSVAVALDAFSTNHRDSQALQMQQEILDQLHSISSRLATLGRDEVRNQER
jgi:hypothetical protein